MSCRSRRLLTAEFPMIVGLVVCFAFLLLQLGVLHRIDRRLAETENNARYSALDMTAPPPAHSLPSAPETLESGLTTS